MNRALLILGLTSVVMLNAQAQSVLVTSAPHVETWGISHNHLKKKGFKQDLSDPILRLERAFVDETHVFPTKNKLSVLSKKANSKHMQGIQTALFFEDRLARFKHTIVFGPDGTSSIKREILALERLFEETEGIMSKAFAQGKSGSWQYESSKGIYKVSVLLDGTESGGVFKLEGACNKTIGTLKQYERHILASTQTH